MGPHIYKPINIRVSRNFLPGLQEAYFHVINYTDFWSFCWINYIEINWMIPIAQ